jgi:hypothetical protein
MMGLGSINGTGIFVSIGIAAGAAGPSVVLAIVVAVLVATCNALSSPQLAADHPVSGGTYEFGYGWPKHDRYTDNLRPINSCAVCTASGQPWPFCPLTPCSPAQECQ